MAKVIVGMSGGVDSAVSAYLLKKEGYEVVGITFVFTNDFDSNKAVEICNKLNIEHHIEDYRDEFKSTVIDRFISDYNKGITPNPCVLCNKEVKFNFLEQCMIKYNCEYMATGHYAKIIDNKLYKSNDLNKDQTYFLARLSFSQLSKLILPLEGIDKSTVIKIAKEHNLITDNYKDSTDVCFINSNFKDFITANTINMTGDVINVVTNEVIGKHEGLSKYTIGQRKGLNIGGNKDRMFVIGKDVKKNILYVAFGDSEYLYSDACIIEDANFISNERPENCTAKFRYRGEDFPVSLEYIDDKHIRVLYPEKVKSVTPGQACVLYLGEECLGCGIIEEIYKNNKKLFYL